MYIIGILILVVMFALGFSFIGSTSMLLNLRSLFLICIFAIPLIISSGLFNHFILGIKIAFGRVKKAPESEIKKVIISLKLSIKLVIISGLLCFMVGCIVTLANFTSIDKMGPSIALALISLLYSLFGISLLLPVQAKAEALLVDVSNNTKNLDEKSKGLRD